MGQMLFSGEDALKPTACAFPGGESARLYFLPADAGRRPNFLVA